jgi:hypothetical protein
MKIADTLHKNLRAFLRLSWAQIAKFLSQRETCPTDTENENLPQIFCRVKFYRHFLNNSTKIELYLYSLTCKPNSTHNNNLTNAGVDDRKMNNRFPNIRHCYREINSGFLNAREYYSSLLFFELISYSRKQLNKTCFYLNLQVYLYIQTYTEL